MTKAGKFWVWVIFFSLISTFGVNWVRSQPENSMTYKKPDLRVVSSANAKNAAPQGDLGALYSELGIEQGKHVRLNPCFDIEELTRKYCTPHSIRLILSDQALVETEEKLLRDMLRHDNACELVALYIGRVCHQENFKKIFKHFALKK